MHIDGDKLMNPSSSSRPICYIITIVGFLLKSSSETLNSSESSDSNANSLSNDFATDS